MDGDCLLWLRRTAVFMAAVGAVLSFTAPVLAMNHSLNGTNQSGLESCGDGICQAHEGSQACPQDCAIRGLYEANKTIIRAKQMMNESSPGYEQLYRAIQQFNDGNYSTAEKLAQDAIQTFQNTSQEPTIPEEPAQDPGTSQDMSATMLLAILAVLVVLTGIATYVFHRHMMDDTAEEEPAQRPEQLSQPLEDFARSIREDLDVKDPANVDELREQLEEAEELIDREEYDMALEVLDRIAAQIEED
jgi:hypothetical protein